MAETNGARMTGIVPTIPSRAVSGCPYGVNDARFREKYMRYNSEKDSYEYTEQFFRDCEDYKAQVAKLCTPFP